MINSDLIKDLQPIRIPYSRKMFYLWLHVKFGYNFFKIDDCYEYGVGKRQIFRYLSDLEEAGMIDRSSFETGGGVGHQKRLIQIL